MSKRSVKGPARRAIIEDRRARKAVVDQARARASLGPEVVKDARPAIAAEDSFVNFQYKLGIGADSPLSAAGYGFNPITRQRTLLEWIHRGSWFGTMAIDLIAEDMTKMGVEIDADLGPDEMKKIEEEIVRLRVWPTLNTAIKWGRLFGGSLAVMLVAGQKFDTPLRLETIGRDQFRGLYVLDRWQVEPSLNDLVTDLGPELGLPKFYKVLADAPALAGLTIHHSRCIRFIGIELSYYQKLIEQLWGESVLERIYDRMISVDSATTGASQLAYKAYLRTYSIKDLRSIIAAGGQALNGLVQYVDMMRRFQSNEGVTLIDLEDKFEGMQHSAFSGLSDLVLQLIQQLSGALQIPLVRMLGQSPAGLSASGESDLRTYYDGVKAQQEKDLLVPVTRVHRATAQSIGMALPDGFGVKFRSLWQVPEKEKAEIAEIDGRAINAAEDQGLISPQTALKEYKQSSHLTGRFSNISDKDIDSAESEPIPPVDPLLGMAPGADPAAKPGKPAKDAAWPPCVVVRHGETDLNKEDRLRGWDDVPLNAKGVEQAQALGEKLKSSRVSLIVSSDLQRASETAKAIAARTGAPLQIYASLRPWHVGIYTGEESAKVSPILERAIVDTPDQPLPGGESFNQFRTRFLTGVQQILAQNQGSSLALVTHIRGERMMAGWEKAGAPPSDAIDLPTFMNWKGAISPGAMRLADFG
jgi:phage-related protein (TIGR01555 family)